MMHILHIMEDDLLSTHSTKARHFSFNLMITKSFGPPTLTHTYTTHYVPAM